MKNFSLIQKALKSPFDFDNKKKNDISRYIKIIYHKFKNKRWEYVTVAYYRFICFISHIRRWLNAPAHKKSLFNDLAPRAQL